MSHAKLLCLFAGAAFTSQALAVDAVTKDEIRAVVAEMLSDAETRTSLLQGGGNAGWMQNGGFTIGSADGKNTMHISGYSKFRYTINFRDNGGILAINAANPGTGGGGGPNTSFNSGFSIRDMALRFNGNVINKDFEYNIRLRAQSSAPFGGGDNPVTVDDIYFIYKGLGGGWQIKGGQFKVAFMRESLMSDTLIQGAERSVVDASFTGGRVQGIEFGYTADEWKFAFGIDDGLNSAGTNWASNSGNVPGLVGAGLALTTPVSGQAAFGFGGRVDWTMGNAEQLADATSKPSDKQAFGVGAAFHYEMSRRGVAQVVASQDTTNISFTVDAAYEDAGWSIMAAAVGSANTVKFPVTGTSAGDVAGTSLGFMLQGGYRWNNEQEVFVRYDGLFLSGNLPTMVGSVVVPGTNSLASKNYNFITFGYNHYFADHSAKLTVDCIMGLNPTAQFAGANNPALINIVAAAGNGGAAAAVNRLGILGTSKGIEAAIRTQFQFLF